MQLFSRCLRSSHVRKNEMAYANNNPIQPPVKHIFTHTLQNLNNVMFGDEYYHSDESAKTLGYSVKGEDDVPWKEGDLYFISPLGAEYPGENGYFSEATAGNGPSSNSTLGNWERSDGGSYMKLSGS